MIESYVNEFLAVVKHLKKDERTWQIGEFLVVDKEIVIELLEKYAYETATNKLKTWKGLNWLDSDYKKLTKRIRDKKTGEQKPHLKINLNVYKTLEKINIKST